MQPRRAAPWLGLPSHRPRPAAAPAAASVLKLAPGDQDALRCKAVLFIESGSLEEALKLVGQPPLAASMAYEKVRTLSGSSERTELPEPLHRFIYV